VAVGPICFVGQKYAAVTFVTRQGPSGLPRRDAPDEYLPYRLHALLFGTEHGDLRGSREWPSASQDSGILPATDDNFVVLTPDQLILYSTDLQGINDLRPMLSAKAHEGWWEFVQSPNRKYLLVSYALDYRQYRFEWIGLDDLKVLKSWGEDGRENLWRGKEDLNVLGGHLGSIYDDEIVLGFSKDFFLTRKLDGPWHLIRYSRSLQTGGSLRFLADRLLISANPSQVKGARGTITLIRTDGEILFQQEFSDREQFRWLASSADGNRIAVAIDRGKGGSIALDIAPHYMLDRVMVYDVPSRQWLYTLEGEGTGMRRVKGLALSADGSLLGLIDDREVLQVYRLPTTVEATPKSG
jgi:hypothetical protein